jgi:hypothetical protein
LFTKQKQHVIEIIYGRGKFVGDFNMEGVKKIMKIMLPILKSPTNLPLPKIIS